MLIMATIVEVHETPDSTRNGSLWDNGKGREEGKRIKGRIILQKYPTSTYNETVR